MFIMTAYLPASDIKTARSCIDKCKFFVLGACISNESLAVDSDSQLQISSHYESLLAEIVVLRSLMVFGLRETPSWTAFQVIQA